jgi:hypothetical protein
MSHIGRHSRTDKARSAQTANMRFVVPRNCICRAIEQYLA